LHPDRGLVSRSDAMIRSRLNWIPYCANQKVLDVACGVSKLCQSLSSNVYGLEINPQAVKEVRRSGIRVKRADIEKRWDFPDNFFDIVYANHIIEHLQNPDHLITESKRVLKKGGLLIIGTPNIASWFNRVLLLFGIQPFFTEVSTVDKTLGLGFTRRFTTLRRPMGHLRIFTFGSLCELLILHGFKPVKNYGVEFLSFPKLLLFIDKLISRHSTSFASNIMIVAKKI